MLSRSNYPSIDIVCFFHTTVKVIWSFVQEGLADLGEMGKPKLQQHRQSKLKTSKSEGIFKFNGCITCRRECIKFIPVAVQQ